MAAIPKTANGPADEAADDLTLLAATVCFALLGNAMICGVISGPHDRYGARLVWIATFTTLIAASRLFANDAEQDDEGLQQEASAGENLVPVSVAANAKHLRADQPEAR